MLIPTLVMAVIAVILSIVACKNGQRHTAGLSIAFNTLLNILPLLVFAFIVGGMVQVLLPHDVVAGWIGGESGFRGILIGTLAGGVTPGGPYVSLPLVAGFLEAGAGAGTMVAFLTSWSLWAVSRLPMEIGILGWRFTLIRLASTFFFPVIAGWLANAVFSKFI